MTTGSQVEAGKRSRERGCLNPVHLEHCLKRLTDVKELLPKYAYTILCASSLYRSLFTVLFTFYEQTYD